MAFPIVFEREVDGSFVFGVDYAYADKGRDDEEEDDDDNSGRGNQNDDNVNDDDEGSNNSGSGNSNNSNSRSQGAVADLHLRYPNGWDEQIRNGRYRLIDPEGRIVSNRRATHEDLARMHALVGQ